MKVVHLSTTDLGGAYKATERIHKSLLLNGVDSTILLRTKYHDYSVGKEVISNPLQSFWSKVKNVGNILLSHKEIISDYFGTDISRYKELQEADIIFLHWVNSFQGYRQVKKLVDLGKPVIWVAHDVWNLTGGCHCNLECEGYSRGCKKCPFLTDSYRKSIAAKNYKKKKDSFQSIIFVGPSNWMAECAKKSDIWKCQEVHWIWNPVDKKIFHPIEERLVLREQYNLDREKKLILFGACAALSDKQKGFPELMDILQRLDATKYELVVFGNRPEEELDLSSDTSMKVHYLGYIHSEEELAKVYSLADIFLTPSRQESFGYTVAEALSCGIPVVAYRVGGVAEQVCHKENGYLAELGDTEELAKGIMYCATHDMRTIDGHNSLMETGLKYKILCEDVLQR